MQAKRKQLKKEGKLLSKKQKEEKATAEVRRKALLESGIVKVEGLRQRSNSQANGTPKKITHGSRKRIDRVAKETEVADTEDAAESVATPGPDESVAASAPNDDREASDEEEKAEVEGASEDGWEVSTDEETESVELLKPVKSQPQPTRAIRGKLYNCVELFSHTSRHRLRETSR